jgi:hypothetical protein
VTLSILAMAMSSSLSPSPAAAAERGVVPSGVAVIPASDRSGVAISVTLTNRAERTVDVGHAALFLTSSDHVFGLGRPSVPTMGPNVSAVAYLPGQPSPRVRDGVYAVLVCLPSTVRGHCTSTGNNVVQVENGNVQLLGRHALDVGSPVPIREFWDDKEQWTD